MNWRSFDNGIGHLCIVWKNQMDEWLNDYMKWNINVTEDQESEWSGFIYNEWIGIHVEMFPFRTHIDHKHFTPSILVTE